MGFAGNGKLYATDNGYPGTTYQMDPLTGALTPIGTFTPSAIGSTVGPNSLIYALSPEPSASFFTIGPSGAATDTIDVSSGFISDGLAVFDDGWFYTDIFSATSDILVQMDPITGAATTVGSGLGYSICAGAMVGNALYGVGVDGNYAPVLVTIDITTGTASLVSAISGMAEGAWSDSVAYNNNASVNDLSVPEPSMLPFVAITLALALGGTLRRNAK